MDLDTTTYAIRALYRTLADRLPAKLRALDAERAARVVCRPGPYVLPEEAALIIEGATIELPEGESTAAEIAALVDAPGVVASVDGERRLVLTAADAPAPRRPSVLRVGRGTANGELGIMSGPVVEVAVALDVRLYPRSSQSDADLTGPVVFIETAQLTTDPTPRAEEIVRLGLQVIFPGPSREDEATLRAVGTLAAAIQAVVTEGDGRGAYMVGGPQMGANVVRCFPRPWAPSMSVWTLQDGSVSGRPFGRAQPQYEIKIWNPKEF